MLVAGLWSAKLYFDWSGREAPVDRTALGDPVGDLSGTSLSPAQVSPPLREAAHLAAHCRPTRGAAGELEVAVRFGNDGRVRSASVVTDTFRDTLTGSCVEVVFRRTRLPPFTGPELTLRQALRIR